MLYELENEDQCKSLIAAGKTSVKFIKADGSTRLMNCTTNEDLINKSLADAGEEPLPTESPVTEEEPNHFIQKVFDLDKNAWRCFVWSRLVSFE